MDDDQNDDPGGGGSSAQAEPGDAQSRSGPRVLEPCDRPACQRLVAILSRELEIKGVELAAVREEARVLRAEAQRAGVQRARRSPHTKREWPGLLRSYLENRNPSWDKVYRLACKEENMSVLRERVHPDLHLVARAEEEEEDSPGPEADDDSTTADQPGNEQAAFPFERLPAAIQARIWRLWLFFEGHLVHALSRFDPFVAPRTMPDEEQLKLSTGLPHLFVWGKRDVSIDKDGEDPNDVLKLLLVSKSFCYVGVHAFYGLNTFAFSSLGELGRFARGIGAARWDRVQHVELALQGGMQQFVIPPARTADDNDAGAGGNGGGRRRGRSGPQQQQQQQQSATEKAHFSARWHPLLHLLECHRLSTLVVHVDETDKNYLRRRYEPAWHKQFMRGKTAGQPDMRDTRALRNLQGVDVLYALRGMRSVAFYDLAKAIESGRGSRVSVRD